MKNFIAKPQKQKGNGQLKLFISQAIMEIFNDPDYGLELTPHVKERLRKARKQNRKAISLEEIKRKYL